MQKLRIGQRWPHAKFRRNRTIFDRVMTKKLPNLSKKGQNFTIIWYCTMLHSDWLSHYLLFAWQVYFTEIEVDVLQSEDSLKLDKIVAFCSQFCGIKCWILWKTAVWVLFLLIIDTFSSQSWEKTKQMISHQLFSSPGHFQNQGYLLLCLRLTLSSNTFTELSRQL